MVYYGLTLNSGELHGNVYVNNALGGVTEAIAVFLCLPGINYLGCRKLVSASLLLSSIACLTATTLVELSGDSEEKSEHSLL